MLPRTSCLTHLIVGTLLAVSTITLTKSNPAFAIRSGYSAVEGVKIYFEIQGLEPTQCIASLDAVPHQ